MAGITSASLDPAVDNGVVGRSIYQSMKAQEAGPLIIAACDANGVPSDDVSDRFHFYSAIANIGDALVNWGADTQRGLSVEFTILYREFIPAESTTLKGAFGYWGSNVTCDLPAITWPLVGGPLITLAAVGVATTLLVDFDRNVAEVNDPTTESQIMVTVDGIFVKPTASVITLKRLSLTFPAATFATGKAVRFFMTRNCIKDAVTATLVNEIVDNLTCLNAL
jgi:hypothetical protein